MKAINLIELVGDMKTKSGPLFKIISASLPVTISYKLNKSLKSIQEEVNSILTVRADLFKKYGELNEESQNYVIKEGTENYTNFRKDLEELLSQDINLEIAKLSIAVLEKAGVSLSALEISILENAELLED